ncbi:MAG: DUF3090 family protein [Acidimicrobiales bacterium]
MNEFDHLDAFTTGTEGPPGQRIFYLQARIGESLLSLRLEKQQVAALADYIDDMLSKLTAATTVMPDDHELEIVAPVMPAWIVGSLGVVYSESDDRVVMWAEELADEEDERSPETARFRLTRGQATAFVQRARAVVEAGRPPCPYCGRPLDDADFCPCYN